MELYSQILDHAGRSFGTIFRHVRDHPDQGMVFHCTAGKDRTGILAALFLKVSHSPQRTSSPSYLLIHRTKPTHHLPFDPETSYIIIPICICTCTTLHRLLTCNSPQTLQLADVSDDIIADDYSLSRVGREPAREKIMSRLSKEPIFAADNVAALKMFTCR